MSNESVNSFNFDDLAPVEIPVRVAGNQYVLREASADAARKWRNAIMSCTKVVDGKVSAVGNLADSEAHLVSLCLFPVLPNGSASLKAVPLAVVLSWPNRIVRPLFEKAKEISDLEEKPGSASASPVTPTGAPTTDPTEELSHYMPDTSG